MKSEWQFDLNAILLFFSLYVHTDVDGKTYTLNVHTASCGNGYTIHVYTAGVGGGGRDTHAVQIQTAGSGKLFCSISTNILSKEDRIAAEEREL